MNIYDLSHKLHNGSPVYPGTAQPEFLPSATMSKEGYRETLFRFHSHLGTHIDAPFHMLEAGKPLDQMAVSNFCGEALIIEVDENIQKSGNRNWQFLKMKSGKPILCCLNPAGAVSGAAVNIFRIFRF